MLFSIHTNTVQLSFTWSLKVLFVFTLQHFAQFNASVPTQCAIFFYLDFRYSLVIPFEKRYLILLKSSQFSSLLCLPCYCFQFISAWLKPLFPWPLAFALLCISTRICLTVLVLTGYAPVCSMLEDSWHLSISLADALSLEVMSRIPHFDLFY